MRALVVVALLLAAGGANAAAPGIPAIDVDYSENCTFTAIVDPGTPVAASSSATIPPGTYQVLLNYPNPTEGYSCGRPTFSFTGPGVSYVTPFPLQELHDEKIVTLQPSSSYVAVDTTTPATQRVFSTSATGSSTSLLTGSKSTAAGSSVQKDIVGSGRLAFRGTLRGLVADGKATLKVTVVKSGAYDLTVTDTDRHHGFFVKRAGGNPIVVSGIGFVGKATKRVALVAGTWSFYAVPGHATRFTVVR